MAFQSIKRFFFATKGNNDHLEIPVLNSRTSKCDLLRKKGLVDVNELGILMQKKKNLFLNYPKGS